MINLTRNVFAWLFRDSLGWFIIAILTLIGLYHFWVEAFYVLVYPFAYFIIFLINKATLDWYFDK